MNVCTSSTPGFQHSCATIGGAPIGNIWGASPSCRINRTAQIVTYSPVGRWITGLYLRGFSVYTRKGWPSSRSILLHCGHAATTCGGITPRDATRRVSRFLRKCQCISNRIASEPVTAVCSNSLRHRKRGLSLYLTGVRSRGIIV